LLENLVDVERSSFKFSKVKYFDITLHNSLAAARGDRRLRSLLWQGFIHLSMQLMGTKLKTTKLNQFLFLLMIDNITQV